jgi:hypothetical protein
MKNQKIMAAIPMVATMVMPLTAFAATTYSNSTANVTNVKNAITTDKDSTSDDTKVTVTASQASTFSVTIPKSIVLAGASGGTNSATYDITVKGNIASDEVVKVVPASSFNMKDDKKGKADIEATVSQTTQNFVDAATKKATYREDASYSTIGTNNNKIENAGTVTVTGLSAGSWTGNFNFTISLNAIETSA